MQAGRTRLNLEERQRRVQKQICIYCLLCAPWRWVKVDLPLKLSTYSPTMSSSPMAFLLISSRIAVPSSHLRSGRLVVRHLTPPLVRLTSRVRIRLEWPAWDVSTTYFILQSMRRSEVGYESPIQDTESVRLSQSTKFIEHKLQTCKILGSFEGTRNKL